MEENGKTFDLFLKNAFEGFHRDIPSGQAGAAGRDHCIAARILDPSPKLCRDTRLIVRHLLPNVLPVLIVAASLGVGQIILIEAALDFLGLGIQPPTASWGNMLTNSQSYFFHSVWLVYFPGITIFVTVLAANLFGNAVRDAFDPRLK